MLIIGSLNNCRKGDDTMSSDKFWSCEVETLLHWILEEEKQGQIFGIRKELFFTPKETDPFRLQRYGQLLETPLGVAAGPHTQLSQNLIAGAENRAGTRRTGSNQTLHRHDRRRL
jgi:hypothetical protein